MVYLLQSNAAQHIRNTVKYNALQQKNNNRELNLQKKQTRKTLLFLYEVGRIASTCMIRPPPYLSVLKHLSHGIKLNLTRGVSHSCLNAHLDEV